MLVENLVSGFLCLDVQMSRGEYQSPLKYAFVAKSPKSPE